MEKQLQTLTLTKGVTTMNKKIGAIVGGFVVLLVVLFFVRMNYSNKGQTLRNGIAAKETEIALEFDNMYELPTQVIKNVWDGGRASTDLSSKDGKAFQEYLEIIVNKAFNEGRDFYLIFWKTQNGN